MEAPQLSRMHRAVQALLALLALIWVLLGIVSLFRLGAGDMAGFVLWVVALMMFGNAGAFALCAWGLGRWRTFFWPAAALLLINAILSVTDQVGFLDLATMGINVAALGLLVTVRRRSRRSSS